MARKFSVGDKVKIVKRVGNSFRKGYVGIIDEITPGVKWPYYMKRRNGQRCPCNARELKLIKRKTN